MRISIDKLYPGQGHSACNACGCHLAEGSSIACVPADDFAAFLLFHCLACALKRFARADIEVVDERVADDVAARMMAGGVEASDSA